MLAQRIQFTQPLLNVRASVGQFALEPMVREAALTQATPTGPTEEQIRKAEWQLLKDMLSDLTTAVNEIELRRQESFAELHQVAVQLAVEIASSVVGHQIQSGEFPFEILARKMIARLDPGLSITVKLNPQDIPVLQKRIEGVPAPWDESRSVRLEPDQSLNRGSCRIDSGEVGLVQSVEDHLSAIHEVLLNELDHAQTERRKPEEINQGLQRFPDRRDTA